MFNRQEFMQQLEADLSKLDDDTLKELETTWNAIDDYVLVGKRDKELETQIEERVKKALLAMTRPTWQSQWCPSCKSKDCDGCTLPHRDIKPTKYEGGEGE